MPRPRAETDKYLSAVEQAASNIGAWINIPKRFKSSFDASMTARCLRDGYLRVKPAAGEPTVRVGEQQWLALATRVDAEAMEASDAWVVRVRARSTSVAAAADAPARDAR